MAYDVSHKAFDFAKSQGLQDLAIKGAGPEFMNRFVAARAASLRPELAKARFTVGFNTMSRIGDGTQSGQFGTARAAVDAQGFGAFAQAISDSEKANEGIRSNASTQWMEVLSDLDSRIQSESQFQRQLDAAGPDWFDRALGVAGLFI